MNARQHLCAALNAWCDANSLPHMSADELCVSDSFGLTDAQRGFLEAFVELWDACEESGGDHA